MAYDKDIFLFFFSFNFLFDFVTWFFKGLLLIFIFIY